MQIKKGLCPTESHTTWLNSNEISLHAIKQNIKIPLDAECNTKKSRKEKRSATLKFYIRLNGTQ